MEEKKPYMVMNEESYRKLLENNRELFNQEVAEGILHLKDYYCTKHFKSVRRAIKKGYMSVWGDIYPRRPFNNRKNTCKRKGHHSRKLSNISREVYGQLANQGRL